MWTAARRIVTVLARMQSIIVVAAEEKRIVGMLISPTLILTRVKTILYLQRWIHVSDDFTLFSGHRMCYCITVLFFVVSRERSRRQKRKIILQY